MPELRTARENARLEIGSQRGRNSHQVGVFGIYNQRINCATTPVTVNGRYRLTRREALVGDWVLNAMN